LYWGFGYDPSASTVSLGPHTIRINAADQAAEEFSWAIYLAAREVDKKDAAELLAATVEVLTHAEISWNSAWSEKASLWVRVKDDSRVWLSLTAADIDEDERRGLSERTVKVLTDSGLRLISITQAEDLETAERLVRGEALYVESNVA
jgi:hypothetical protein